MKRRIRSTGNYLESLRFCSRVLNIQSITAQFAMNTNRMGTTNEKRITVSDVKTHSELTKQSKDKSNVGFKSLNCVASSASDF